MRLTISRYIHPVQQCTQVRRNNRGVGGPQILADRLNLLNQGGPYFVHNVTTHLPRIFRLSYGPVRAVKHSCRGNVQCTLIQNPTRCKKNLRYANYSYSYHLPATIRCFHIRRVNRCFAYKIPLAYCPNPPVQWTKEFHWDEH